MLIFNDNWVYRNLYERHFLMSIESNEILCISPAIGELFAKIVEKDLKFESTYIEWCSSNHLKTENDLTTMLKRKGVIYDVQI